MPFSEIFLSYSTVDILEANELYFSIQEEGLRVFMSGKDLTTGEIWDDAIRQALRDSVEVCILVTPTSLKSEWVMGEAWAAWALGKRTTPIFLNVDVSQVPHRLRAYQGLPFHRHKEFAIQAATRMERAQLSGNSGNLGVDGWSAYVSPDAPMPSETISVALTSPSSVWHRFPFNVFYRLMSSTESVI